MVPILPSTSPADLAGLSALLVLIADPKAAKKRLDELKAQADTASTMMDDVRAERQKAGSDAAVAERRLADAVAGKQAIDDANAALAKREAAAAKREAAFADREGELRAAAADLAGRERALAAESGKATAEIGRRSRDLDARAVALGDAERAVAEREAAAEAMQQQAERRLAAISAAAAA